MVEIKPSIKKFIQCIIKIKFDVNRYLFHVIQSNKIRKCFSFQLIWHIGQKERKCIKLKSFEGISSIALTNSISLRYKTLFGRFAYNLVNYL
jgi:hypothetical protein